MRRLSAICLLLLPTVLLHAQRFTTAPCPNFKSSSGSGGWFLGHEERVCELRRITLPVTNGQIDVSGANGSIEAVGQDRGDIALEARVEAQGSSHDDAMSLLHRVEIVTNGSIHADGPNANGWFHGGGWSVSYRLLVPRHLNAKLHSANGAVSAQNLDGDLDIASVNGAVSLAALSGQVRAHTVNGPIAIALAGDHWRGAGLEAETVNGGISVTAADGYSAHLLAQTVNGGIALGFPVTIHGTIGHHVDTNLGHGGPTLHFQTVNGGINVTQSGSSQHQEE